MDSATGDNSSISTCAACGKAGDNLKTCTSCKQVKYCNRNCQKYHWPKHKKECKQLAASSNNNTDNVSEGIDSINLSDSLSGSCTAVDQKTSTSYDQQNCNRVEISDDKLFADPPKQECPICMLPMLFASRNSIDMFCCGKSICVGCVGKAKDEIRKGNMKDWCLMCRVPTIRSNDMSYLMKRTEVNDPEACHRLGQSYLNGQDGLLQDHRKAFELFYRGAEFGSIRAHYNLACAYLIGEGGEQDVEKAVYHMKLAAIGGHEGARYTLGILEKERGDINRAMKHYMIAARSGYDTALKAVCAGYKAGHVTKDDYAKTLRTYQHSCDEMKSEQRSQY